MLAPQAVGQFRVRDTQLTQESKPVGSSLWDHNGSTLYLVASGPRREFYYQAPRPEMLDAGASPRSLLFSGRSIGNRYVGTAYFFHPRCGKGSYEVSGPILDNYKRVVVQGRAPKLGDDCRVHGYFSDRLEFTFLGNEIAGSSIPSDRTDLLSGYDNAAWFISAFWSGEYPPGFSVTRKNVVISARAAMDKRCHELLFVKCHI
jgi:hypothetical protein